MCGILGANFAPKNIEQISNSLLSRGPDNFDYDIYDDVFLAHSRLSIVDLTTASNQPMNFDNITITFNGEIYNYKELILQHNLKTITKSDTEVIIRLYQKYSFDCLKYLNGAFAFCIYDQNKKILFCARDRFGKKPFYYYFKNNKFIFSSQIRPILKMLPSTPNLNTQALSEYLSFFAPISNISFYQDINKLPKASYMVLENNKLSIKKYYKIKTKKKIFNLLDATKNIEEVLYDAISYRLNSDVEIGVLLSGGVDSSLIATIYSKLSGKKIETFSVGYENYKKYDELDYAQIVADDISSYHHSVVLNKKDFIQNFDKVLKELEEPLADTSAHPLFYLSNTIHQSGIKSVLSGEGSDELFLGYEKYFKFIEFYKFRQTLTPEQREFFKNNFTIFKNNSKESEYFKRVLNKEPLYQTFGETFSFNQKKQLFNKHIKGIKFLEDNDKIDFMSKVDLDIWIGEVLLQKLDKMAMANSVENRNPFLDYNLVDLIFSIDNNLKQTAPKFLLKTIAKKYLPPQIINRKKKGFNSPFNEWLFEEFGTKLLDDILKANKIHNLFNIDYLKSLEKLAQHNKFRQHFYSIYLFSKWFLFKKF